MFLQFPGSFISSHTEVFIGSVAASVTRRGFNKIRMTVFPKWYIYNHKNPVEVGTVFAFKTQEELKRIGKEKDLEARDFSAQRARESPRSEEEDSQQHSRVESKSPPPSPGALPRLQGRSRDPQKKPCLRAAKAFK